MKSIAEILPYVQIILSVLIVSFVLLQQSDADLGGAFGGSDNFSAPARTRRGLERTLFNSTIFVAILFVISTVVGLIIR
ncbi:MAG: preprotein translocase subunit SecG [Candidatus Doudnabacteria bacterium]|nr:preprotein translocase subunit SecG [Candidatus Doudnabacteria bacterium]